jgi:hypothetical protein
MAPLIRLTGIDRLKATSKKVILAKRRQMQLIRKEVVMTLVLEMMKNIPVFTGRTIESIRVNSSGSEARKIKAPPPDTWHEYGATNRMKLGAEPMRGKAETRALAEVNSAPYLSKKDIHVTINSTAWPLVENALAPGDGKPARNQAVVSQLALAATMAKHPYLRRK